MEYTNQKNKNCRLISIIALLSMCLFLSSCGKEVTEVKEVEVQKSEESVELVEEVKEASKEIENIDDIDFFWYENRFFRSETDNDTVFYIQPTNNGKELDAHINDSVVAYLSYPMQYEILNDEEGRILRYSFEILEQDYHVTILYYVDLDKVGVSVNKGATGETTVDNFYFDEILTIKAISFDYNREQLDNTSPDEGESLDMPDIKQIENDAKDEELPIPMGIFTAEDGSDVFIEEGEDGCYLINIGIFRLCTIEAKGCYDEGCISFTGIDPSEEPISGYVEYGSSSDELHMVFTDSSWDYLPNGTEFSFYR